MYQRVPLHPVTPLFPLVRNYYLCANMKKMQLNDYEAPVAQVIEVNREARILDASLTGTRNVYGAAVEDTWN